MAAIHESFRGERAILRNPKKAVIASSEIVFTNLFPSGDEFLN